MTIPANVNCWCPSCEEICHDHDRICTICGSQLCTSPPSSSSSSQQQQEQQQQEQRSSSFIRATTTRTTETIETLPPPPIPDYMRDEVRRASQELRIVMNNIRDQIRRTDEQQRDLLQNIRDTRRNEFVVWQTIPTALFDPQQGNDDDTNPFGQPSRGTSKEVLDKLPRIVLEENSSLFRTATVQLLVPKNSSSEVGVAAAAAAAAAVDGDSNSNHNKNSNSISNQDNNNNNNHHNVITMDAIPGEFQYNHDVVPPPRPLDDDNTIQFDDAYLVVATYPRTGKGGTLSKITNEQIFNLITENNNNNNFKETKKKKKRNIILYMERGDNITFVQKAIMAQQAGGNHGGLGVGLGGVDAVIIGNDRKEPWPYIMKDSKNEASKFKLKIPVVMIKQSDGQKIIRQQQKQQKQQQRQKQQQQQQQHDDGGGGGGGGGVESSSSESSSSSCCLDSNMLLKCHLSIEKRSTNSNKKDMECVVCTESFQIHQTIIRLPTCYHIFHEDCAMRWLVDHNTCPYCRYELPAEDEEYEQERQRRRQQQQQRTNSSDNNNNNNNNSASAANDFYG